MKKLALIGVAIIVVSCSTPDPDMKGAYNMTSHTITGAATNIIHNDAQLKLYTEEYMMYTRYNPKDSVATFGLCAYTTNGNEVIESAIYSASGATVSDSTQNYQLMIEWTDQGYKQAITGMDDESGLMLVSTEEYQTISSNKTSPLDGAWEMTNAFYVNQKNDTIRYTNAVGYKTYFAGSHMFGNTMRDSLNIPQTNIGFGTFEMNGDSVAKETIKTSSWLNLVGQTVTVALKWNGPDEFTERISGQGGESWTETYKRLGR